MCFHNPEYTCSSLTLRLWGLLWLTSEYTPSPCTRGTWLENSSDLSQASQGGRNGAVLHHTAGTGLQSGLAPTSFWRPGFFLYKRKAWVLEPCAALNFQNCGSRRRPCPVWVGLTFTGAPRFVFQTPRAPHLLQQPQAHHSQRALREGGAQCRPGRLRHSQEVSALLWAWRCSAKTVYLV